MGKRLDKVHAAIAAQKQAIVDLEDKQSKQRNLMAERFELLDDKYNYLAEMLEEKYDTVSYDLNRHGGDRWDLHSMMNNILDSYTSDLEIEYRYQSRKLDDEYEEMESAYSKQHYTMEEELEKLKAQKQPAFEADREEIKKLYE